MACLRVLHLSVTPSAAPRPGGMRQSAMRQISMRMAMGWSSCGLLAVPFGRRWPSRALRCGSRSLTVKQGSQSVGLHFFSDANFKPLRDQFVNSVVDEEIELKETIVEDLNVIKQRTAGGVPVYKFKTKLLLDALEDAGHEEILLISDVDIQFFGEVMPLVRQGIAGRDMCFQREFTELGVNIGFVAIRRTAAAIDFWNQVWEELPTGRHDQRIVNNLLYTEKMPALRWGCFPPEIWASSQAFDGGLGIPKRIVLHHANWIIRDYASDDSGADASNPTAKLRQLAELRGAVEEKSDLKQRQLVQRLQEDPDLASYHQRP
ncbi:unnamed protein product [Cladocopium goreaui]|uniref:Nucleotide-diphospho-sugar transferase domain-containing protein n=1 Tax=Cladocopium goreaui TaxID=2562237 RepID=A0A9P1C6J2_9DINO|nr:unnamed protein product [Cladocopium goreaui]